jgi:hypothetical protein
MMLDHFLLAVAAHATFDLSKEALKKAFDYISDKRPDLAKAADVAEASGDVQAIDRIFRQAVGIIEADADAGLIQVDNALLVALNGIKFDHQNGNVTIHGSTLSSNKVLVTGGGPGSTGKTTIGGDTSLRSKGTAIDVGGNASIVMTGGASIKQS